jgi:hypothetical protein
MARVERDRENRDFSRITFHRPAELTAGGETVACELLDISLDGALLRPRAAARYALGERCSLVVRLDGALEVIRMSGTVAHRETDTVGVRCDQLDLDSVTHLRRLVELNLGDEHLLDRELAALLASRSR